MHDRVRVIVFGIHNQEYTREGGVTMKRRNDKKRFFLPTLAGLTIAIFLAVAGSAWAVDWPKDVTVVSPAPGASVHMVQVGVGKVVEKYTPIESWIVQPLGGPKLWLHLMKQGKCQFANHNAADILNAFLGRGLYAKMGPQSVRTLGAGHDYMFMFWTTPDKGIRSVADLRDKIVYYKFKANPMFDEMAKHQLGSVGLTVNDLKAGISFPNIKEGARDLIEGRIDALLYPVVPGAVMQINEAKGECVFVNLTKEQANYVIERMEGYFIQDIAAGDQRFRNKSAVPNAICYQNAMFAPASMHPDIVYGVAKAIYEHSDEFADTHPAAKYWSLKHRPVSLAVPYHEGSIRYFKEKGLWTSEAQAYQDKMLQRQKQLLK
jgi:TRAP transporter TAXI family solute receptor